MVIKVPWYVPCVCPLIVAFLTICQTTLGPLSPNTGTLTITTIFTLVSLLRKLIIWFKTEYWPLYQELVTQPIVAQTT